MRVLLIGKGGREHALAWKIAKSDILSGLYLWPGSPVMGALGEALDLPADAAHEAVVDAAVKQRIDLVVCGPEAPLSLGLADRFAAAGIPTFGPVQAAARLEASKAFAKDVMQRAGIPTAAHALVTNEAECRRQGLGMLRGKGGVVLKASGLAAGKGVFVCTTEAELEEGLRHLYHSDMQTAAETVVLEEVLRGRECSYFSLIGAGGATGLGFAVDFKRLEDGDQGPNTGGMGCYAPVPWLPADAERQVVEKVVEPLLATLRRDGIDYCGCLYVGVMWSETVGPQVVEFNVRFGDPEAEVLALYDDRDWLAVMAAKCGLNVPAAKLAAATASVGHGDRAVVVVMASKSYPFGTVSGESAELPEDLFAGRAPAGPVQVFGASVGAGARGVKTGSGRVLIVGARAGSFTAARSGAYDKIEEIAEIWRGARWRGDIAKRMASEVD